MYELFYGLSARPFRMTPDLDYFCLTQIHKRALAHLRYGLQQAEGFVVLTGMAGTGKTMLTQLLLKELSGQKVYVGCIDYALHDGEGSVPALVPALLKAFDKPITELKLRVMLSQFETFLLSRAQRGSRCVIVIDEAQHLSQKSLEILRLLSNIQFRNQSILQVVLVGDLSLDENLSVQENHLLRQRIVISYQLTALQLADTEFYITHRLSVAGSDNDPMINPDVFPVIQALSQGLPSEINRFFDRLLMQSMLGDKHTISAADLSQLLADDGHYGKVATRYDKSVAIEQAVIETVADVEQEIEFDIDIDAFNDEIRRLIEDVLPDAPKVPELSDDKLAEAASIDRLNAAGVHVQTSESHHHRTSDIVGNGFVDELNKEFETQFSSQTNNTENAFDQPTKKKSSGIFSTLMLSYLASVLIAVLLFYADGFIPLSEAIASVENNPVFKMIDRGFTSIAIID